MNERIQQLAEQAGLKHHNWITNESNVKDGDFKYPRLEDYEKFAELIVRECARYMYEYYPHSRYEVNYMRKHMGDTDWNIPIEAHFGVEE